MFLLVSKKYQKAYHRKSKKESAEQAPLSLLLGAIVLIGMKYELLTDHEIYYIKIELDLRKFSNGPFSETKKGFGVIPTPG